MPIYVYKCPDDGLQDVLSRTYDVLKERPCTKCDRTSKIVVTAPGMVDVKRDWNEKANDYRRDPYTQSKAQLTNIYKRGLDLAEGGESPIAPTEEAIQIGAKEIDKQNKRGGSEADALSTTERRAIGQMKRGARKKKTHKAKE